MPDFITLFDVQKVDGTILIRLSDRVDVRNIESVITSIADLVEQERPQRLVLNLKELHYLQSVALGHLYSLNSLVNKYGGSIRFCELSENVSRVIGTSRFHTLFEIRDSEAAANADWPLAPTGVVATGVPPTGPDIGVCAAGFTISIEGDITMVRMVRPPSHLEITAALQELVESSERFAPGMVLMNLDTADLLPSQALGNLIRLNSRLQTREIRLCLCTENVEARRAISWTGMTKLMGLYSSESECLNDWKETRCALRAIDVSQAHSDPVTAANPENRTQREWRNAAPRWTFMGMVMTLVLIAGFVYSRTSARVTVSGQVTFEGEKVADGTIMFIPYRDFQNDPFAGTQISLPASYAAVSGTIQDGVYSLASDDSLTPGVYKVEIRAFRQAGENRIANYSAHSKSESTEQFIPPQFNTESATRVDVNAGKNVMNFPLRFRQ